MTAKRGYNKLLEKSSARMQRELRLREWLALHQKYLNAIWKTITDFAGAESHVNVSADSQPASWEGDTHRIQFLVSLRQLQGLKDPRLEKIITPFLDAPRSSCKDYPQYLNRDYIFDLPGGVVQVYIAAYVAEENPTCRRVLVERKVTPQVEEVYKLSCDGDIVESDPVLPKIGTDPLTLENEA